MSFSPVPRLPCNLNTGGEFYRTIYCNIEPSSTGPYRGATHPAPGSHRRGFSVRVEESASLVELLDQRVDLVGRDPRTAGNSSTLEFVPELSGSVRSWGVMAATTRSPRSISFKSFFSRKASSTRGTGIGKSSRSLARGLIFRRPHRSSIKSAKVGCSPGPFVVATVHRIPSALQRIESAQLLWR